jgi:hypothetical protein
VSRHYWRNGAPTEAGIVAFTEGDCWILAIHLHLLTDWPVYVVDDGAHWVVKVPGEDLYLDVTGVHTRSSLLWYWKMKSLRRCDSYTFQYAMTDVAERGLCQFAGSHGRAPVMARRLLEKHGVPA